MSILSRVLCLTLPLSVMGCGQDRSPADSGSGTVQSTSQQQGEPAGAQLWAENCSRCHNIRPPQSFSAAQWQVIVHHMRLRANLTGNEARLITQFLQESN